MHVNALIVRPQAVRELPADRVQGFGASFFLACCEITASADRYVLALFRHEKVKTHNQPNTTVRFAV